MSDILKVEGIEFDYSGQQILFDVDFTVKEKERHAIIGPNGAGKTTLFNVITGALKPSSGRIIYKGQDITGRPPFELIRKGVGRSFQITDIFRNLTVRENIQSSVLARGRYRLNVFKWYSHMTDVNDEVSRILDLLNLSAEADIAAGNLSHGKQRALEIGLTMALKPDLILLDEPAAGMSKEETLKSIDLIRTITEGISMIIIEHDMDVVFNLADTVTVLQYGKVLCSDAPDLVRCNPDVREAYLGKEED